MQFQHVAQNIENFPITAFLRRPRLRIPRPGGHAAAARAHAPAPAVFPACAAGNVIVTFCLPSFSRFASFES